MILAMGKRKKKTGKKEKEQNKPSEKGKEAASPSTPTVEEDSAFDFGGLPQRDLKKSLGCG